MKKTLYIIWFALVFLVQGFASPTAPGTYDLDSLLRLRSSREVRIEGKIPIVETMTPVSEIAKCLFIPAEHPAAQDTIPPALYALIEKRARELARDSLTSAELFRVLRPGLEWLQQLDPHLRVEPQPRFPSYSKQALKRADELPVPGFLLLDIGDTLIVRRSVDPQFEPGDRILSINGVAASTFLEYCYDDRLIYPFTLLTNYRYMLVTASGYTVRLERNGAMREVTTPGIPWPKVFLQLGKQAEFRSRIFPEAKTGYFPIPEFYPNNKLLIGKLRQAISEAKKQGCDAYILDLRGNPGGSGSDFDRLLSIFIDKASIPYLKGQRVRVSKPLVEDYDFLADSMIGQLAQMPERAIHKEVALDRKMFIPGMRYYVLMDKDTGSIAASFCNILQYNNAARLAGEPLRRNALKYGEVLNPHWLYITSLMWTSISTAEIDEYTRAIDGVLMPDMPVPYIAADYLSGRDGMLERLLALIGSERKE